jgi:asparagine synthase (glutamine-hydrolysing)
VGHYTPFKDVYSTQSGELVKINHVNKNIEKEQYFQWVPYMQNDEFKRNYKEEAIEQEKIFLNVFERMLKSAPNVNNWIIPLSGGYYSRTIVNYLYKIGAKNVICFSYGIRK